MYRGKPKDSEDWYLRNADDNGDYFAFGEPVYATGDGRIAAAHDGEPDDRRANQAELARRETATVGNYVVIDHMNGEYSWFAHLKNGSVKVKRGQIVKQGDVIGQVGASGDSLFPHLHYDLTTAGVMKGTEGLPSYFSGFHRTSVAKTAPVVRAQLDTGDVVENP
jgi:hypothetical protein